MPSGVYVRTKKCREILSKSKLRNPMRYWKGKKRPEMSGKNNPNWKEKVTYHCHQCGKIFEDSESTNRKFCSRECYAKDWGKRMAKNTETQFKKGHQTWNKDKKCPQFSGKNSGQWKGDKAKYSALHMRIRIKRGNPSFCEVCKTTDKSKKYEWANLTGKYEDVMDYKRMCVPCHSKYDNKRRKQTKKEK